MTEEQKESHRKVYRILVDEEWCSYMLKHKDYYAVYRLYGYQFLLSHLEELEKEERYSDCAEVIKLIEEINKVSQTKIPTRL